MKPITTLTLLTLIMQGGHMGSRVVASLLALDLGAGPLMIGVLIASYSIFQLGFALIVGRISDRYGSRRPMLGGSVAFGAGLLIPALSPTLPALFISAPLIGIGFVFFNVAAQNLAGTLGTAAERTRNFSLLSLGYSSGHMIGPVMAGFIIDRMGFASAYVAFAVLTLGPVLTLAFSPRLGAQGERSTPAAGSAFDLLRKVYEQLGRGHAQPHARIARAGDGLRATRDGARAHRRGRADRSPRPARDRGEVASAGRGAIGGQRFRLRFGELK